MNKHPIFIIFLLSPLFFSGCKSLLLEMSSYLNQERAPLNATITGATPAFFSEEAFSRANCAVLKPNEDSFSYQLQTLNGVRVGKPFNMHLHFEVITIDGPLSSWIIPISSDGETIHTRSFYINREEGVKSTMLLEDQLMHLFFESNWKVSCDEKNNMLWTDADNNQARWVYTQQRLPWQELYPDPSKGHSCEFIRSPGSKKYQYLVNKINDLQIEDPIKILILKNSMSGDGPVNRWQIAYTILKDARIETKKLLSTRKGGSRASMKLEGSLLGKLNGQKLHAQCIGDRLRLRTQMGNTLELTQTL